MILKFSASLDISSASIVWGGGEGGKRGMDRMVGNFEHIKSKLLISHRKYMIVS